MRLSTPGLSSTSAIAGVLPGFCHPLRVCPPIISAIA